MLAATGPKLPRPRCVPSAQGQTCEEQQHPVGVPEQRLRGIGGAMFKLGAVDGRPGVVVRRIGLALLNARRYIPTMAIPHKQESLPLSCEEGKKGSHRDHGRKGGYASMVTVARLL